MALLSFSYLRWDQLYGRGPWGIKRVIQLFRGLFPVVTKVSLTAYLCNYSGWFWCTFLACYNEKNMQAFYGLKVNKAEKNERRNTVVGEPERYVDSFLWLRSHLACEWHHLIFLLLSRCRGLTHRWGPARPLEALDSGLASLGRAEKGCSAK